MNEVRGAWSVLGIGLLVGISAFSTPAAAQTCPAGTSTAEFEWSDSPGTGNEWTIDNNTDGASQTYPVNYIDTGGSPQTIDVTVTLSDPDGMNGDSNFVCPYGPPSTECDYDGALMLRTETNGAYTPGPGGEAYLTVAMASQDDAESVAITYDFSRPGFFLDELVTDIDDIGYNGVFLIDNLESYQDEITVTASLGGVNAPLTLSGGSNISVAGQTARAIYDPGIPDDISHLDPAGHLSITVDSGGAIDSATVTYSNGPDDAATELANPGLPFSGFVGDPGDSDGHAIALSGFQFCILPKISGNVFNDLDALTDGQVDGAGTNAGGIWASLIDPAGNVVASVQVNPDGTYEFLGVTPNTTYTIQLNSYEQVVGGPPAAPNLPAQWINTGENLGASIGDDGTVDGVLTVAVAAVDVPEANFGIQLSGTCEVYEVTFDEYTLATANSTIVFNSEYATGGADNTNSPLPADRGFTISALDQLGNNFATAYNTTPGTGGQDADLETSNTGNGLIIQEIVNRDTGVPNPLTGTGEGMFIPDDNIGETLTFDFEVNLDRFSATLLDFDADAALVFNNTVTGESAFVSFADMVLVGGTHEQTACTLADEAVCVMDNVITASELGISAFNQVVMDLSGAPLGGVPTSGGIDNIVFQTATCGSIGGTVTEDTTGDTLGDTPIEGVTVQLYSDPNGDGDPSDGVLVASTLTLADGSYLFPNLAAGDYVVVEIDPATYASVSDTQSIDDDVPPNTNTNDNIIPVTLTLNEDDLNNDFVDFIPASVAGTVWFDEDEDGINDIEEARLTGVTLYLCLAADVPPVCDEFNSNLIASTVTDANGDYLFPDVFPGDYTIQLENDDLPAGLILTAGPFGFDPRFPPTVNPGDAIVDQDFGYIPVADTGAIGDRVWSDANGDGIQDPGEAGIEGVVLELQDGVCTPTVDCPTTTTNANGDYLFTGVPFGDDYVVSIDPADPALTGYSPTSGPQSEGGYVGHPVTLSPALQSVTDVDFGFNLPLGNTIIDHVFYDANGDGVLDAGDALIAGVTIDLLDAGGNIVASATTDANGEVVFTGLPDGTYTLRITDTDSVLTGLDATTAEAAARLSDPVAVAGGATDDQDSFGLNNPGSIAGTVYSDPDSNADQDPNEPGLAGVTVELQDGVCTPTVDCPTFITGPDGSYLFDGLPPGDYVVVVSPPTGTQTEDPDVSIDDQTSITLGVGESSIENDFGYNNPLLNDIYGAVFLDPDKDGVEEFGEPGIAGVTLDLLDAAGNVIATTTTEPLAPDVIDGLIDINGDGVVDTSDDGVYFGFPVIDGFVDLVGMDGINAADDGELNGFAVIDGIIDVDGDGIVGVGALADEDDDTILPNYSFEGLLDGAYQVAVTDTAGLLTGYDITSGLDTLDATVAGADVFNIDFGYVKDELTGSLSGEVFIDENLNGLAEGEEFDLSGVTVYLCLAADVPPPCDAGNPNLIASTVTDANGEYVFNGLGAEVYEVATDPATIPAGLDLVVDPAPVALSEGENVTDVDIGYDPLDGALSGVVWTDTDNDGNFDPGEAPIGGVDINVYDANGTLIATTTTNPDGSWLITGLTGPTLLDDLAIIYDAADIPADLNSIQPTNLPVGDDLYFNQDLLSDADNYIGNLDFGFAPEVTADLRSICGNIYADDDQSDTYVPANDGEFEGVTLNLLDDLGNIIATTVTVEPGVIVPPLPDPSNYCFTGLPPGEYQVVISDINNVLQDVNPNAETLPLTVDVTSGNAEDVNAGFVSGGDSLTLDPVGNKFWFDIDGDGIVDDNEPGIEGITVQIWLDNNGNATPDDPSLTTMDRLILSNELPELGIDNLVRTTTTDENGEYYFTNLPAGQYIVVVSDSLGFVEADDGTMIPGGVGDNLAKPWIYTLTHTGTTSNLTADFGVSGANSLSGHVFEETESTPENPITADGLFDGVNDAPAVGVTVVLLVQQPDGSFTELQSTTTDSLGDYSFTGLPDGNYRVVVQTDNSVVDGYDQTADPDQAGVCTACDDTYDRALAGGANVTDIDFGYQKTTTTTPVTVNYFSAEAVGGGIEFTWETSNEVGHVAFQVYARTDEGWVLLNEELIESVAGSAMDRRQYRYTVYGVDSRWFSLVDVSAAEEVTPHGPFRVGQVYGAELEPAPEFDWNGIKPPSPGKSQVEDSVNYRLQHLLEAEERAARDNPGAE